MRSVVPLVTLLTLLACAALAAARSMFTIGNDLAGVAELWLHSLAGPFTGWVFHTGVSQRAVCLVAGAMVCPLFLRTNAMTGAPHVIGLALWFAPNVVPMMTGA